MQVVKRYFCRSGGTGVIQQQPLISGASISSRINIFIKLKTAHILKNKNISKKNISCQANRAGITPVLYIATNPFGTTKEKSSIQKLLSSIPSGIAYVGAFVFIGLSAVGGWIAGSKVTEDYKKITGAAGSIAGASIGVFAMVKASEMRESAAAIDINNLIASKGDASELTRNDVEKIEMKYGSSISKNSLYVSELKSLYDRYLESMIPMGDIEIEGTLPDKIRSFKMTLGITDEDAAAVHMDVGRRFSRSTFEEGTRVEQMASRKRFQRWIYISYRVFGERKAAFLLPMKRVFKLTDSQITVARRDNAKSVFKSKINELGGILKSDREFLESIRKYQLDIQLSDDVAEEVVTEYGRKRVENSLSNVLKIIRERTRVKEYSKAMKEIDEILIFNRELEGFSKEENARLPPGLTKFTIHGGAFEKASSTADQREIFEVFFREKIRVDGQYTVKLGGELGELSTILGLGVKESENVRDDVCSDIYKTMLREEISSGRLDAAESKAEILQELCNKLQFKPEIAATIHKNIYKQRVEAYLSADGCITDENNNELQRIRKLLCISQNDIDDVIRMTVGYKFRDAVEEALSVGIDNFNDLDRENVAEAMNKFKINEKMGIEIFSAAVRKTFLSYVTNARIQPNKLDASKELKKMIFFNNVVVTPLLNDIKKSRADIKSTMQKLSETLIKASEEAASGETTEDEMSTENVVPRTLEKASKGKESLKISDEAGNKTEIVPQKEITLLNDLDLQERIEMYRNYLLYCMTGETIKMPMGGTVVVERDEKEFGRLSQLGDVLGLTPVNVMNVHTDLAEQAFRQQVKSVISGGTLTKEMTESLEDIQNKMGLTKEQADKIIKGVQGEYLASSLQSAEAMGELTLQKLIDMKESGVDLSTFTNKSLRQKLFQNEAEKLLSDGEGKFDVEYMLKTLPEELDIDPKHAKESVMSVAKAKRKLQVVQAMSDLRMKNFDSVTKDVNNIIVCTKVSQYEVENNSINGSIKWERRDEILDLYSVYYWKNKEEQSKLLDLQEMLDISESEAESLKKIVDNGELQWTKVKDDEVFF